MNSSTRSRLSGDAMIWTMNIPQLSSVGMTGEQRPGGVVERNEPLVFPELQYGGLRPMLYGTWIVKTTE